VGKSLEVRVAFQNFKIDIIASQTNFEMKKIILGNSPTTSPIKRAFRGNATTKCSSLFAVLIILLCNGCKKTSDLDRTVCFTPIVKDYYPIKVGESVQFTNCSSSMYVGFRWSFGDGGSSLEKEPSYIWNKEGTYIVSMQGMYIGSSVFVADPYANLTIEVVPN